MAVPRLCQSASL